jgi:hypothetical protein
MPVFAKSVHLSVCGCTALVDLGRYVHTEQHKQNKRTQTSMPQVGFKITILVFVRAKTVHALDRASTVIGVREVYVENISPRTTIQLLYHYHGLHRELNAYRGMWSCLF